MASNGKDIEVEVPPTRSDIMHACDIMEDVGIAYSFNKLPREVPKTVTVGMQQVCGSDQYACGCFNVEIAYQ